MNVATMNRLGFTGSFKNYYWFVWGSYWESEDNHEILKHKFAIVNPLVIMFSIIRISKRILKY